MGNVKINNNKLSNIGTDYSIDNDSDRDLDIECAMGNVTIEFEE